MLNGPQHTEIYGTGISNQNFQRLTPRKAKGFSKEEWKEKILNYKFLLKVVSGLGVLFLIAFFIFKYTDQHNYNKEYDNKERNIYYYWGNTTTIMSNSNLIAASSATTTTSTITTTSTSTTATATTTTTTSTYLSKNFNRTKTITTTISPAKSQTVSSNSKAKP